jgi:hypothetical protein
VPAGTHHHPLQKGAQLKHKSLAFRGFRDLENMKNKMSITDQQSSCTLLHVLVLLLSRAVYHQAVPDMMFRDHTNGIIEVNLTISLTLIILFSLSL